MPRHKAGWADYEIREGGDGKVGIYTREFNCRLAVFNANTYHLQTSLKRLFDRAAAPKRKPKPRKPPRNTGAFSGDVGDQGYRSLRDTKARD